MRQPEIVKSYFLYLNNEEINVFEKVIEENGMYETEDRKMFVNLFESSYIRNA